MTVVGSNNILSGVFGSSSASDNAIARFDGNAKRIQSSGITIDDSNNVAGIGTIASASGTLTIDETASLTSYMQNLTDDLTPQVSGNLDLQTSLLVGEGGSSGIYVNSNGYVGIGTTSPGGKLVVKGAGTTTGIGFQTQDSAETARVTVLDNGNVGIGTTGPGAKLHVSGGNILLDNTYGLQGINTSSIARNLISMDAGNQVQIGSSINDMAGVFISAGSAANAVTIKSTTGNVGIGTTGPSDILHIYKDTPVVWIESSGTGGAQIKLKNTEGEAKIESDGGSLGFRALSSGSNQMVITSTGNVGIGTSAPDQKLHLYGDVNGLVRFHFENPNRGGNGQVSLFFDSGGYEWIPYVKYSEGNKFSFWSTTLGKKVLELNSSGDVAISNGNLQVNGAGNSYIIGNIGIGTTTPTAKLDINSDIIRLRTTKTPVTAGAAGNAGDICWDADYIYICVATNTWKRSTLSTW